MKNSDGSKVTPNVALVWSQAQKEGLSAKAQWPGLPGSPDGHSPKKLSGHFSTPQTHHLQEELLGLSVLPER